MFKSVHTYTAEVIWALAAGRQVSDYGVAPQPAWVPAVDSQGGFGAETGLTKDLTSGTAYGSVFTKVTLSTLASNVITATVQALGPFAASGVNLVTPRARHSTVLLGAKLYVIGGNGGSTLALVERSQVDAAGNLGAFAGYSLVSSLLQGMNFPNVVVVGNYLYVIGGFTSVRDATV